MGIDTVPPLQSDANPARDRCTLVEPVRFSIVTPTLNAAEYLRECLESVAQQVSDEVAVEHLILDGGSTDATLAIVGEYGVRRVPRRPDQHVVEAMCLGYEAAQGDLAVFLGADDLLLPGALAAVARIWRREQRPVLFCRSRWVDAHLQTLGELAPPPRWLNARIHACLGWNYLGAASSFVSPGLYRALGGFDRQIRKGEDYEFFTRILHRQIPFSCVDQAVCLYRRTGDNASLQQDAVYHHDLQVILDRYGPRIRAYRHVLKWCFKAWVYARNPQWAAHQVRAKLAGRHSR